MRLRGQHNLFEDLNDEIIRRGQETARISGSEYEFGIDKSEIDGDQLMLTISLYRSELGERAGRCSKWQIVCDTVRDHRISHNASFCYCHTPKDHPYLWNYNKPRYTIYGSIESYGHNEIVGKLYNELLALMQRYFSLGLVARYLPSFGVTGKDEDGNFYTHLCSGPIAIVNIYKKVFQLYGLSPRIIRPSDIYNNAGPMKLLLLQQADDSLYVVAKSFSYYKIDEGDFGGGEF
jgi:hypothetical protein